MRPWSENSQRQKFRRGRNSDLSLCVETQPSQLSLMIENFKFFVLCKTWSDLMLYFLFEIAGLQ